MSNTYVPDPEHEDVVEKKNPQQLKLLILLLLIAVFGYLYFFTGLIKPRPQAAKPEPAKEATTAVQVRKPLPPRPPQQTAQAPKTAPAAGEAQPQPEIAGKAIPAAPPAAKPAAKPAAPPAAKPAEKAAPGEKAAGAAKPAAAGKAGAEKGAAAKPAQQNGAAGKPAAAAKAQAEAKPAAAAKAGGAAAGAKGKPQTPAKEAKAGKEVQGGKGPNAGAPAAAAEKETAGEGAGATAAAKPQKAQRAYALVISGDLAESEVAPVVAKLKKAGVTKVQKVKVKKSESMHRLFLADFANHDEAKEELDRLKQVAPQAFMLNENGRYAVYAGSFMRQGKAATEQDRLLDKGVKLMLKTANAPVTVLRLHAGGFADRASAEKAAKSLKGSGVTAQVVKQ